MNDLWQLDDVLAEGDRQIINKISQMSQNWGQFDFYDVLSAYREFDYLLKRNFLALVRRLPKKEAYSLLHDIWLDQTKDIYSYYQDQGLFASASDSTKLADLIELSFFHSEKLLSLPISSAIEPIPVISVIMPVYRSQQYLWETLRSIYEQTYQDFELILVNEYQNDDPLHEIISIFEDTRTYVVQKQAPGRLGLSLNIGIRHSRGEFVARMDSDDIALPNRFSKQIEYFREHPEVAFCGTQYRSFGTTNNWNNNLFPLNHREIQCRTLKYCSFLHPTVMWKREALLEKELFYNEEVLAEDTEFFARIVYSLTTANLPDKLLLYRREGNNLSIENLKKRDANGRNLAVVQSLELEKNNLALLYQTLDEDEHEQITDKRFFTYADALNIFKRRLNRPNISDLLPPDTSKSDTLFAANLHSRIPVIWGYGWNGQVLEFKLQEQGIHDYRIVDQRLQEMGTSLPSLRGLRIEDLNGMSDTYFILVSMDRRFTEVTNRLHSYGYQLQKDYIEYFI